jgi:HEPN domain-containing protein
MNRYKEWIARAKSSFDLAQVKIFGYIQYEDLCFQLQQSAEKALKGLLIYYGVEPEFTHNIQILLNELEKFTEIPDSIAETNKITKYAVVTRYPGEYDDVTKEDYEKAVKITKECLDWVDDRIKESEENQN